VPDHCYCLVTTSFADQRVAAADVGTVVAVPIVAAVSNNLAAVVGILSSCCWLCCSLDLL
jgi:hypothetical protein